MCKYFRVAHNYSPILKKSKKLHLLQKQIINIITFCTMLTMAS